MTNRVGILAVIIIGFAIFGAGFASATGVCSDVNMDGEVNGYDVDALIDYVFRGGELPQGDVDLNDDGFPDIVDVVLLIDCVYRSDSGEACLEVSDLGDKETESVYHDGENSLQTVLDNLGFYFDVDQDNTQTWIANNDMEIEITFLKTISSYRHEFGYYTNSDPESFQKIFDNAEIEEGDSFIINIDEGDRFGFGVNIKDNEDVILSENFLNSDQKDRVLAFAEGSDFILAFEDWVDWDYQDLVVKVKILSCGQEEPVCGDENLDAGEQCDDGNNNGIVCNVSYGGSCEYCSNSCELINVFGPYCGDNAINGQEFCDDGNNVDNDLCSNECIANEIACYENSDCGADYDTNLFCTENNVVKNKTTYTCNNPGTTESYCSNSTEEVLVEQCNHMCMNGTCHEPMICGDGNLDIMMGEQCDDGNNVDGDGCSSTCQIEITPVCGNSIVEQGELCDAGLDNGKVCDNDNEDCNYCSLTCQIVEREEDDRDNDDDDNEFLISDFMMNTCNVNWVCTGWSECDLGTMTRDCKDTNNCGLIYNKPIEKTSCDMNKVLVEESKSTSLGVWILIALIILAIIVILVNWNEM